MSGEKGGRGFEPEIVVFFCQQAAGAEVSLTSSNRKIEGATVRLMTLPCSSKIEVQHLLKVFEQGADGVEVVGCPDGSCSFLVGSNKAEKRVAYVCQILEEIKFGPERLGMSRAHEMTEEALLELAGRRAEQLRALGPNPVKLADVGKTKESVGEAAPTA